MVGAAAITLYSGALTTITVVDSIRRVRTSIALRVGAIALIGAASIILAVLVPANFLTDWSNFLLLIFYFLVPWSAVNLVDFFIIRKGKYAILEIFNPKGMYGRWGWRGLTAYFVTVAIMVPFFSTPIFTGPVANALAGADLSVLVGLPVAAVLYYVLARGVNRTGEMEQVAQSNAELERELATRPVAAS
jgi:purine-cytosine permease-like protein